METATTPDVFLSYASVDRERVFAVADAFEQLGLTIWVDRTGIAGGTAYGTEIANALRQAKALVLMCSAVSLASKNVRQEIMLAWRYGRPIVPLLLEPVEFPDDVAYWLEGFPWIDAYHGEQAEWLPEVLNALARHDVTVDREAASALTDAGHHLLPPTNLPTVTTPLVGRAHILAEVRSLLEHGRWVTLTGSGGTGKTRLAIELGRLSLPDFRDGVWFVDLASLTDPLQVIPAIAEALGVVAEPGEEVAAAIVRDLQHKRLLLILDNMEHLAAAAEHIAGVQEAIAGLTVLVTSRRALHIAAEWVFDVPQLLLPDLASQPSTAALAQNPAVALFIQRAVAAKPDFVLGDGNARVVAEICQRLDGLPLAIELAAARVRLLPPQVLLTRLGSRLNLLTRGGADGGGRHRTLRDTIAWSYDLLAPEHQHLFRRAAVLRGASTLEAVGAVAGEHDVVAAIQALVDQSLLRIDGNAIDGVARVVMLETIREFALEQLESLGEVGVARQAHAVFFADLIDAVEPQISAPQPGAALTRMRADVANLRAALDWYAEQGDDPRELLALAQMHRFWSRTGWLREAHDRLSQALVRHPDAGRAVRGKALLALGWLASSLGDYSAATDRFQQAQADLEEAGSRSDLAALHHQLGWIAERAGELDEAIAKYQQALAIYEELGDPGRTALLLHDLGMLRIYEGRYQEAIEEIGRGVEVYRSLADARSIASGLSDLGSVKMLSGDFAGAQQHLAESVALFRTLDDLHALSAVSTNLGRAYQLAGDYERAKPQLEEALLRNQEVGAKDAEALALYGLGMIAHETGDRVAAEHLLRQSLNVAYHANELWLAAEILEGLGRVDVADGKFGDALRAFGVAMAMRDESGSEMPAAERAGYKRSLDLARQAVGEAEFGRNIEEGKAVPLADVVAEILAARL